MQLRVYHKAACVLMFARSSVTALTSLFGSFQSLTLKNVAPVKQTQTAPVWDPELISEIKMTVIIESFWLIIK